jgi:hypothetical protein
MTKAEKILSIIKANPSTPITHVARECGTSRAQVRRVLKRRGLYKTLPRNPFIIPAPKFSKKITSVEVFLCDLHIPHHDEGALSVAYRELLDLQPDVIYLGGDVLDFHKISYFSKDPEEADIADEVEKTKDFFWQLRGDFPNTEIILEGGNHVSGRWESYMVNTNIKGCEGTDIDSFLGLDVFDIQYRYALEEMQVEGGFPKRGKLYHLHGDEAKISFGSVNIARTMFLRVRDNAVFGHFHKTQEHIDRDIRGDVKGCWSVGCLCDLTPRFRPINDWNHGFAVIYYNEDGTFELQNKKIVEGMVL